MISNDSATNHAPPVTWSATAVAPDWAALLWCRKPIVIAVTVFSVILGFLYYQRTTPIYQSSAQLLLIKNEADLPITGAGGQVSYEDALSTHMILICSPLIVRSAIEKHRLGSLPSLEGAGDPLAAITYGLDAVRGGTRDAPDPNVIHLTYRGTNAQDCAVVLGAVIESYQEFLGDTYQNFSDQTVELISRAKDELGRQLSEKEAMYRQFRGSSPHWLTNSKGDRTNVHEMRMTEIEQARARQLLDNTQLKARIDAIESVVHEGGSREALTLLARKDDALTSGRTSRDALETLLVETLLDETRMLEDFGEDHPQVISVRKKLDMLREHLGGLPNSIGAGADFFTVYLDSLRQQLAVGSEQLAELNELFAQEQEAAKSLATFQIADETYRSEIARTQQLFDGVIKRLEEINLVQDDGGVKTQLISPPARGQQVEPTLALVLALSTVLGLLLGACASYVVERTDQRFRSPEDLRRQLGLPIVGHIPVISSIGRGTPSPDGAGALDPSLCAFHEPEHAASEAYRAVRTALYFGSRGAGHQVVQITSPTPGDGKTTLSANLAISAANSGKRVLLIEADFRRPRLAELFCLAEHHGVSSVITGDVESSEAIKPTVVENLFLMPCGPRPNNPSELLTSGRFQEVLDAVRHRFDLILVDTPPLLVVTDPAVVASRVDTVLLVVSLDRHVRHLALRASEVLDSIGANVLGVVVNRIDRSSGYSSQRYGYAYRCGYADAYGYGYSNYRGARKANRENGKARHVPTESTS